ncbi:MAG: FdhF/YdeP family oxidoreductase [Bacteroidota bacterium]|nr:FdhF/YdeP family oxidoreductase [Bacteroidota bacterium]
MRSVGKKIRLTAVPDYAAGLKGVRTALAHAVGQMGPWKAMRALSQLNQEKGFDCPGCAWPDPDDKRSLFAEYCENGAKAVAEEATNKRADPFFFSQHSIEEMLSWSDYEIGKSGRLTHPMVLHPGATHYEPLSWRESYQLIASHLNHLSTPNEAIFYTSGRSSNEAAFLWGLFARAYGTNNMPDCSNMCHESTGVALSQTLGIGKGSVILEDLHEAEVIIVIGQNPGTNHPRMLSALQECKNNGGEIITINPIEEAGLKRFKNPQHPSDYFTKGTIITDLFLQVKINEDVTLLKAIMLGLAQMEDEGHEVFDHDFIKTKTAGFENFMNDLRSHHLDQLAIQSGVSISQIKEACEILASATKIIICWAMGLTQHKNGVENIKECVNLLLLKGAIGKKGAGACPVRGHSNVQGDRTVGIMHHPSIQLNLALKDVFGFDAPTAAGLDTVHCIQAMYEGKAKVFIGLGGNFVSAASDTNYTMQAMRNCELTVQISTKLNRSHLVTGKTALVLPTLGRSEKDVKNGEERKVTVENSMGKVHTSQGHLRPASDELMSEPEIVAHIADATLGKKVNVEWLSLGADYHATRDVISRVISGFNNYNERVEGTGFYLPNTVREGIFTALPQGRAQFSVCSLPAHNLKEDEFMMMTLRSHDQFNTTIYGLHDRYRGVFNERRVVFINPADMKHHGLQKLDLIDVESNYDGILRRAEKFYVVPYDIPRQNLAAYFPEMNVLVPINHFADESNTPISKSVVVTVVRVLS